MCHGITLIFMHLKNLHLTITILLWDNDSLIWQIIHTEQRMNCSTKEQIPKSFKVLACSLPIAMRIQYLDALSKKIPISI